MELENQLVFEDCPTLDLDYSKANPKSRARIMESQLPQLRRYARALCGSQKVADLCIAGALENLAEGVMDGSDESDAKIQLFRAFTNVWENHHTAFEDVDRSTAIGEVIDAVEVRERQVFLLTMVEGFSLDEARQIMDMDKCEAENLLLEAKEDLAEASKKILD